MRSAQHQDPTDSGPQPATEVQFPVAEIEDLQIYFRTKRGIVHAVDGVTLDVREGETLGLVGETGSGKTVTARSLLRLVPSPPGIYAGGRVLIRPNELCSFCYGIGCSACSGAGKLASVCPNCRGTGCEACDDTGRHVVDILKASDRTLREIRGNNVAVVFQDPDKALNPALSIRYQIAEVFMQHRSEELLREAGLEAASWGRRLVTREARGRSSFFERRLLEVPPLRGDHQRLQKVLDEWILQALSETRISNPRQVMNSWPHELSGGMKQRVMIAQALACDPDLLVADEPTTALDVTIQARILDLIGDLQERHNAAVLYISHDLSLVRRICDRVAVMYAGNVAEIGTTAQIFGDPKHPYTRGLLAAIPTGAQRGNELRAIEGTVPEMVEPGAQCRFHTRCPYAAPVCASLTPPLREHGGPGQRAACFLYEDADELGVERSDMPTIEA